MPIYITCNSGMPLMWATVFFFKQENYYDDKYRKVVHLLLRLENQNS